MHSSAILPCEPNARVFQRRDENTVRVTNLPEETTDQDLRELFSRCGKVSIFVDSGIASSQHCYGWL